MTGLPIRKESDLAIRKERGAGVTGTQTGCGSHYSFSIIENATEPQVVLVSLPANITPLFQPPDVVVFASFKGKVHVLVNEFPVEDEPGGSSIDNVIAVRHSAMLNVCNKCKVVFRGVGPVPLPLLNMLHIMDIYTHNNTDRPLTYSLASC